MQLKFMLNLNSDRLNSTRKLINDTTSSSVTSKSIEKVSETDNTCYLLELPAELRNYIYELAMSSDLLVVVGPESEPDHGHQSALTKVNRQTREETLPIFYGKNTFRVTELFQDDEWIMLKRWLSAIRNHSCLIRTMQVSFCDAHWVYLEISSGPRHSACYRLVDEDSRKCKMRATLKFWEKHVRGRSTSLANFEKNIFNAKDFVGMCELFDRVYAHVLGHRRELGCNGLR